MSTTTSSSPSTGPTVRATPAGSGDTTCAPDKGMCRPGAQSPDGQSTLSADNSLRNLVHQVNSGDNAALAQLRSILDEHPEIWQRVGDLATHARMALIRLIAGGDKFLFESIERKATDMEVELLGASPTPLERLSVERVVDCWLQLQHADTMSAATTKDDFGNAKFWSQNQDRAHRRYQSAVKQLLSIQETLSKATQTAVESAVAASASPEPPAVRHADPDVKPRPAGDNGNGNGEVPKPGDRPDRTNGQPANRMSIAVQFQPLSTTFSAISFGRNYRLPLRCRWLRPKEMEAPVRPCTAILVDFSPRATPGFLCSARPTVWHRPRNSRHRFTP